MKTTKMVLSYSHILLSITTKVEGCFLDQPLKLDGRAADMARWLAAWVRDGRLALTAEADRLKHSAPSWTTGHLFMFCGKITVLGIAWVPLAWPANNHPWNVQFHPILEEKEIILIWASRDLSSFVSLHRPWNLSSGLFVLSFAPWNLPQREI